MKMDHWILANPKTGFFLPEISGSRGYTHIEPSEQTHVSPRLFNSEQAAGCALTWWLKGKCNLETEWDDDLHSYYNVGPGKSTPVPGRKEFEIKPVQVRLVLWNVK